MKEDFTMNMRFIKQVIDKNEFISELKTSHQKQEVTQRCHEIIHLLCYKLSSKYIRQIRKINYSYNDFVTDVYIYSVKQVFKFDINREKLEPFSYFTSTVTHAITALIKKTLTYYVRKIEFLKEEEIERQINSTATVFRNQKK